MLSLTGSRISDVNSSVGRAMGARASRTSFAGADLRHADLSGVVRFDDCDTLIEMVHAILPSWTIDELGAADAPACWCPGSRTS